MQKNSSLDTGRQHRQFHRMRFPFTKGKILHGGAILVPFAKVWLSLSTMSPPVHTRCTLGFPPDS
ncbi:hypothetical protein NEOLEDRAFT_1136958 [Neolentinus lepideus HHB14362 ss-1]|uniref:Uncharacterized protein n=1 Tax=Neolentinus lepideus HHB14362 ss-1 TaxID=1314782 RepID=A0A165QZ75_9AGAM|nr:hypothetical protein NEOLEDRAFT_1136958 [Neolentinus lepideus HHB14362 ss-1]